MVGAALLVVGSLQPLVRLSGDQVRPRPGTQAAAIFDGFFRSFETSVVDLGFPSTASHEARIHDTYSIASGRAPSLPARLVLLWGAASVVLAATRRRVFARITCVLLSGTIVWLFAAAGAKPQPAPAPGSPAGWTAYPPLSVAPAVTPLENCRPTWGALALGTALLAASTFLRARPAPPTAPQPPPLP